MTHQVTVLVLVLVVMRVLVVEAPVQVRVLVVVGMKGCSLGNHGMAVLLGVLFLGKFP